MSQYSPVLLAELPCLGIPRLGVIADIKDREHSTESVIKEFNSKKIITRLNAHQYSTNLAVLPACIFAVPDNPITNKVELETLLHFPAALLNESRKQGYPFIVWECQGQLSTPMTFSALKTADIVIIPISSEEEVAFTLINLTRIYQIFKYPLQKFKVVSAYNLEALIQVMTITDEEGNKEKVEVLQLNYQKLIEHLIVQKAEASKDVGKREKKRFNFKLFKKKSVAVHNLSSEVIKEDQELDNEGLIYEEAQIAKIKL